MFYVYILRNNSGQLYAGITTDIKRRIIEHNAGQSRYTKGHLPWRLIFMEVYAYEDDAIRREKYFKTTAGKRTLRLMLRETLRNNNSALTIDGLLQENK